jgi:hypothetical protein
VTYFVLHAFERKGTFWYPWLRGKRKKAGLTAINLGNSKEFEHRTKDFFSTSKIHEDKKRPRSRNWRPGRCEVQASLLAVCAGLAICIRVAQTFGCVAHSAVSDGDLERMSAPTTSQPPEPPRNTPKTQHSTKALPNSTRGRFFYPSPSPLPYSTKELLGKVNQAQSATSAGW